MDLAQPAKRPRSVTLTLWGVYLLGVWNFSRALALSQQRALLQELASRPNPAYRLIMALVWGIVFIGLAEALRRRRPSARRLIPLMLACYALYETGLIFFVLTLNMNATRQALALETVLIVASVVFTFWALNRTAVSRYFIDQESA